MNTRTKCKICLKWLGDSYCCKNSKCRYMFRKLYNTNNYSYRVTSFRSAALKTKCIDLYVSEPYFNHCINKYLIPKMLDSNAADYKARVKFWGEVIAEAEERKKRKSKKQKLLQKQIKEAVATNKPIEFDCRVHVSGSSRRFIINNKHKLTEEIKRKYKIELLTLSGFKSAFKSILKELNYHNPLEYEKIKDL